MGSLTAEDHNSVYQFLGGLEASVASDAERSVASAIGSGTVGYGAGGPLHLDDFRTKRPPTMTEMVNAYKSVAFACISLNANAVAKVPLRLYARTGRSQERQRLWSSRHLSDRERRQLIRRMHGSPLTRSVVAEDDEVEEITDPNHPLLDVLARPNPYFDGFTLIQHLCRSLDTVGQAHWEPRSLGPGFAPHQIWALHSQYCFPVKGTGDRIIDKWSYLGQEIPFEDLVWFRFVSVRDPYGSAYSPLHACFEQLGLIGYYTATVESILKNGARPETIVSPKDPAQPWSPEQAERNEKRFNNRFGRGGQGRAFFSDGSVDVRNLTYSPTDLGGVTLSREARLLAANCFDVPISMLETENSNKATASEGSTQHQRNAVAPRCSLIGSALTVQIAWPVDRRYFFAFDCPIQEDKLVNARVDQIYLTTGVKLPNEVRSELGYEPRDGGDEPYRPGSSTPEDKPEPGQEDEDE